MRKSTFKISKMDCPSEESMIRMKLENFNEIRNLDFDLNNRKLTVFHNGEVIDIEKALNELNLGSEKIITEQADPDEVKEEVNQRKVLWIVLAINFSFFIIEITTGLISNSMGLVADSLDMLADSFVYGLSLFAVGGVISRKKKIASIAGYFQVGLAVIGFVEVLRRFFGVEIMPDPKIMIIVSVFALIGNVICLYLLQRSKSKEAHMQASMIFTSNDVIINTGVIIAGLLVMWLNSQVPDLIIGTIVFLVVIRGAIRILKLGK